jgi:hypothetical protein
MGQCIGTEFHRSNPVSSVPAQPLDLVSGGSADIFIAKFDASGSAEWAKQAGGANADRAFAVAVDGPMAAP